MATTRPPPSVGASKILESGSAILRGNDELRIPYLLEAGRVFEVTIAFLESPEEEKGRIRTVAGSPNEIQMKLVNWDNSAASNSRITLLELEDRVVISMQVAAIRIGDTWVLHYTILDETAGWDHD